MFVLANPITLKTHMCFLCNKEVTFIESDLDYIYRHLIMDHQMKRNIMAILVFTSLKNEYLTTQLEKFPVEMKLAKDTIEKEMRSDDNESNDDVTELNPLKINDHSQQDQLIQNQDAFSNFGFDEISLFVNDDETIRTSINENNGENKERIGSSLHDGNDLLGSLNHNESILSSLDDNESVLSLSLSELITSTGSDNILEVQNDSGYNEDLLTDLFTTEEEVAIQTAIEEKIEAEEDVMNTSEVISFKKKENGFNFTNDNGNVSDAGSFILNTENRTISTYSDNQIKSFINNEDIDINGNGNIKEKILPKDSDIIVKNIDEPQTKCDASNLSSKSEYNKDQLIELIAIKHEIDTDSSVLYGMQNENQFNTIALDTLEKSYDDTTNALKTQDNSNIGDQTFDTNPEKQKVIDDFNPSLPMKIKEELKSPTQKRTRLSISYEEQSNDDSDNDNEDESESDDEWMPSKKRKVTLRRSSRRSMTTGRKITAPTRSPTVVSPRRMTNSSKCSKPHRSVQCGNCITCKVTKNCGACKNCKDMRRFGGAGKKKQKCKERKCLTPVRGLCNSCQ